MMTQEKNTHVPDTFRYYFWDVNFKKLAVKKDAFFIIKRVLDRGNLSDIRWLFKTYEKEEIRNVIMGTRDLARPTGNLWADVFDIDKSQVPCLQKPYFPIHFGLSS